MPPAIVAVAFAVLLAADGVTRAQELILLDGPTAGCALVADTARNRIVAIGGYGDTWECDGARWRQHTASGPYHAWSAQVFDAATRRVLVVGYHTWLYDGARWQQSPGVAPPGAGYWAALAFDGARNRPLLFGGSIVPGGVPLAETWEWNGNAWSQLQPATSPPARQLASMAFDSVRARIVLFGGEVQSGSPLADTWEWDGVTWRAVVTATAPTARSGAALGYDAARQRTVLFGGAAGPTVMQDVWEYDGVAWSQVTPAGPLPSARSLCTFLPDPAGSELLLLGGGVYDDHDGWTWNGVRWLAHAGLPSRPYTVNAAYAYETQTDGLLQFGGYAGANPSAATWRFGGGAWTRMVTTGPTPAPRVDACMWSDLQDAWLFGGEDGSGGLFADTWHWTGTWTSVVTSAGPAPRSMAAIAWDAGNACAVLFGGRGAAGPLGDTWTFDGAQWTLQVPAAQPTPRANAGMTYDLVRGRVVLFGGTDFRTGALPPETWEWNGSNWTLRTPAASPPPQVSPPLVYDLALQRVLLVNPFGSVRNEVWEYDGTNWSRVALSASSLSAAAPCVAAYQMQAQRVVVIDRTTTWGLDFAPPQTEVYGSSCGADAPALAASEPPRLATPQFALEVARAPANAPVLLGAGTTAASVPFGPCTILVSPVQATALALANGGGAAAFALPIPLASTLLGTTLRFQAAALDPTAALGIALTAGLRVCVGD